MQGANPIGYLDNNPIIMHAIPDAMAVEKILLFQAFRF